MLKDFNPRLYQQTILHTAINYNTLVVLPTGMGKTGIAVMLSAQRLKQYPQSKILVLAPTKPLVEQIKTFFLNHLDTTVTMFTGQINSDKRAELWKTNQIIVSTPQGLENDIINKKIDLKEISLLVLDECLTGDTKVLLTTNTQKTIKELYNQYIEGKDIFVKSYNIKKKQFENCKVIGAQKIPCIKDLYEIETESGIKIKATNDHKFLVKNQNKLEWLKVEEINFSHELSSISHSDYSIHDNSQILTEKEIFNTFKSEQHINISNYKKAIKLAREYHWGSLRISKKLGLKISNINNWIYGKVEPLPIKVVNQMKKLSFLPLNYNNPNIKILVRILGHLYGDGWLSYSKENKFILGFSGSIEGLKEIQNDLNTLGLKFSNIYSRITESKIKGRKVKGTSNSFDCTDRRLARLMVALGCPIGRKVIQKCIIPQWLINAPLDIKREFLGALFGSELTSPKERKDSASFYSLRFSVNKVDSLKNEVYNYVNQIRDLLKDFGINVSQITELEGNIWKDGVTRTLKILMTIANEEKNMVRFYEQIPIRYAPAKYNKGIAVLTYLINKNQIRQSRQTKQQLVFKLKAQRHDNMQIAKKLDIPLAQVESWAYKKTKSTHMIPISFNKFDSIKEYFPIIFCKIKSIKKIKKVNWVYDLTIDQNPNFIANGLIVHNCHRAIGDYSYVWITKQYEKNARFPRILALTASPGSDIEKIKEITDNLFIEEVEVRTSTDPDVRPYIQQVNLKWLEVELPESFKEIKKFLDNSLRSKLLEIKNYGFLSQLQVNQPAKIDILKLQGTLHSYVAKGEKSFEILKSMSLAAEAMKVFHALELIQSQGIESLYLYLTELEKQALTSQTKAVQNLVKDLNFRSALIRTKALKDRNIVHPKMEILKSLVEKQILENSNKKIIIFSQYRDTIDVIYNLLKEIPSVKPEIFVGQAKKKGKGLSQKKQLELLDKFKNNTFNILISSSVGEEGLDIPAVDQVIFYEPVPSAIRHIQRRGRTGRLEKGNVIVLCAKGTIDEGYRWSAFHKEKRMYKILADFKAQFKIKKKVTNLHDFVKVSNLKLFIDYREKGNPVIKELIEQGINVTLEKLDCADYILSNRVGIEYKKVDDFINSILDARLLEQVKQLKNTYERPLFIIEGEQDIYSIRNIHANAIRGMLSTIAVSYGIPILRTQNHKDTAALLEVIAKREQEEIGSNFAPHASNKPKTLKEQQEYIVSSFPGVGSGLSQPLLKTFKSIKNIINASEEQLKQIDKIGDKKASNFKKIVDLEYV